MKKNLHSALRLKSLATIVLAGTASLAFAQEAAVFDFADHDFMYKIISSGKVKIVSDPNVQNGNRYIGDIVIPAEVTNDNVTYKVTEIGSSAFSFSDQMTSITLGENIETIGFAAFSNCKGITEVVFPASVRTVEMGAFLYCPNLAEVKLNEGLEVLRGGAFSSCNLQEVTIPASVSLIENGAFGLNEELTSVTVAEGNENFTSVDGVLYSANLSILYCYPAGKPDTDFEIPATTTAVIESSFEGAKNIVNLTIPESVNEYGSSVFYECLGLRNIYCLNRVPVILPDQSVFDARTYNTATLHVPSGCVDRYKNAVYWQRFSEILPNDAILVNDIKLNASTLDMQYGDEFQLIATVLPEDAYSKTVVWTTSNDLVASVDNTGLVHAYDNGEATITCATPTGSVVATCKVTVSEESSVEAVEADTLSFTSGANAINIISDIEVSIFDAAGRTVYAGGKGSVNLPSGLYIIYGAGKAYKVVL